MKEFSKVVFTQAVLTSEAQEKVIQLAKKCFGGMHSNVCAHHMTISFQPTREEYSILDYGQTTTLYAVGITGNQYCQTVLVETVLTVKNKFPHITISHTDAVKPRYSNELLDRGNIHMFKDAIPLEAMIGWSNGKDDRYYKILTDIENDLEYISPFAKTVELHER